MVINQIIEGWRNKLIPSEDLKDIIAAVRDARLEICNECPKHSKYHCNTFRPDDHCTQCGCTLSAKTSCLSCKCPLDPPLWDSIELVIEPKQEKDES